jgi:hypothetical protein
MTTRTTQQYILSKKEYTMAKLKYRAAGETACKAVINCLVITMSLDLTVWELQYHEEMEDGFRIIFATEPLEDVDLNEYRA